jgi:hypothetical protein
MALIPSRLFRGRPYPGDILPGNPVSAPSEWSEMGNSANWLLAKGACLVPLMNPSATVPKSGNMTFRFRVRPRGLAIARQWSVWCRAETAGVISVATLTPTGGSAATFPVQDVTGSPSVPPMQVVQLLAARSSTEGEISIKIDASSESDIEVYGIDCYELDRPVLVNDSTDFGTSTETIRPREPIFYLGNTSVRGVFDGLANSDARRVGLAHLSMDTTVPIARTSATFADMLTLGWRLQAPKLSVGATTGEVKWAAYARMATSGGTGGSVRITSSSGVSDTATVTGTSFAWTATRTISINCDTFSTEDGFVSDVIMPRIAGDGTRSCEVAAISIWVDSVA